MPPKVKTDPDAPVEAPEFDAEYVAELERENAELRGKLDEVTRNLAARALAAPDGPQHVFISEGVRADLEMRGEATDPGTGYLLRKDSESGEVAAYRRVPSGGVVSAGVPVAQVRDLRG